MRFPAQENAYNISQPFTVDSDKIHGTHFSHSGVGGYIEFPSLQYIYDIPINGIDCLMNSDGVSSGRRKLGMLVYCIENNKFYQLIPKKLLRVDFVWNQAGEITSSRLVTSRPYRTMRFLLLNKLRLTLRFKSSVTLDAVFIS